MDFRKCKWCDSKIYDSEWAILGFCDKKCMDSYAKDVKEWVEELRKG